MFLNHFRCFLRLLFSFYLVFAEIVETDVKQINFKHATDKDTENISEQTKICSKQHCKHQKLWLKSVEHQQFFITSYNEF